MPYIDLSNEQETIKYYYEEQGAGPPLLLLHGFSGSHIDYTGLVDEFARLYRVITLDLPGHGKTVIDPIEPDSCSLRWVAVDIEHVLDQIEVDRAHIAGYSMGARMALYLAAKHPTRLRTLILESGTPGIADDDEREARAEKDEALASDIEDKGIDWFVEHWGGLSMWDTQSDEVKEVLHDRRAHNSPEGLAASLRGMGQGSMDPLWKYLSRLTIPVQIIAGEQDEKYSQIAREMDEQILDSELTIVNGAGHNIHMENPEAYAGTILAFLHEHENA